MQDTHIRSRLQIIRAWARNYRSISEGEIELDPLTVLVGPNASGKSNWLDVLRFMKDAIRFDPSVAIYQRQGLEAIYHSKVAAEQPHIEVGITATVPSRFASQGYAAILFNTGSRLLGRRKACFVSVRRPGIISDEGEDSPVMGFSSQGGYIKFSECPAAMDIKSMLSPKDGGDVEITALRSSDAGQGDQTDVFAGQRTGQISDTACPRRIPATALYFH